MGLNLPHRLRFHRRHKVGSPANLSSTKSHATGKAEAQPKKTFCPPAAPASRRSSPVIPKTCSSPASAQASPAKNCCVLNVDYTGCIYGVAATYITGSKNTIATTRFKVHHSYGRRQPQAYPLRLSITRPAKRFLIFHRSGGTTDADDPPPLMTQLSPL